MIRFQLPILLNQSLIALVLLLIFNAGGSDSSSEMNQIAERYVKLVLAVGQHDQNYVDAFYGPEAWQAEAKAEKRSLDAIKQEGASLVEQLRKLKVSGAEEIVRLRHQYLIKQLESLVARV